MKKKKKKIPPGIVNPFHEPKKKAPLPSPYDDTYGLKSEDAHLRPPPLLDLDGDSFIIRFTGGIEPEKISEALIKMLYDVNNIAKNHLNKNGVWVGHKEPGCQILDSPFGIISVYGSTKNEIEAFRRIGATLWGLPDKQVLKKHQVKIIKRG